MNRSLARHCPEQTPQDRVVHIKANGDIYIDGKASGYFLHQNNFTTKVYKVGLVVNGENVKSQKNELELRFIKYRTFSYDPARILRNWYIAGTDQFNTDFLAAFDAATKGKHL